MPQPQHRLLLAISLMYTSTLAAISPLIDKEGHLIEVSCDDQPFSGFYGGLYAGSGSPRIEFGGIPFARCRQYFGTEQYGASMGIELAKNTALAQFGFISRGFAYGYVSFQPLAYLGQLDNHQAVGLELKTVIFFGALKLGYYHGEQSQFYGRFGIGF